MKKKILFFALAAVCAALFSSCTPIKQYFKSYSYEAKLIVNYGTDADIQKVSDELKAVIGDATLEKGLSSPADDRMKSGFEAVEKKYSGKLEKSAYFTFKLIKTTIDPAPDTPAKVEEELGEYKFGNALQHPYAFYNYTSDHADAVARLKAKKGTIAEEDYTACGQTLFSIEDKFKTGLADYNTHPWLVSNENDDYIKKLAEDIAAEFAESKTAVDFTYAVGRVDMFTKEATILWQKTFKANL